MGFDLQMLATPDSTTILCSLVIGMMLSGCGSQSKTTGEGAGVEPAIMCPAGTVIRGSAPPLRRELLPPARRTAIIGVDCTSLAAGSGQQAVLNCAIRMAQEGYKQWCEKPTGEKHGPYIGWDKTGLRHRTGAYKDDVEHGLVIVWNHFGEISELGRFVEGQRQGSVYRFYKDEVRWTEFGEEGPARAHVWKIDTGVESTKERE